MDEPTPFYSTEFPQGKNPKRYLLDDIPAPMWKAVRAKAKREKTSMRALILRCLKTWLSTP